MGVNGCEFYIRGFMEEQRPVGGPLCMAFASLHQFEEKIGNIHEFWKNCTTCSKKN